MEPVTEEWYDGPKLLEWLSAEFSIELRESRIRTDLKRRFGAPRGRGMNRVIAGGRGPLTEYYVKVVNEMAEGREVSLWMADSLLTQLALHVSLIPDSARIARPEWDKRIREELSRSGRQKAGYSSYSDEDKRRAIEEAERADSVREASETIGIPYGTLKAWYRASRDAAAREAVAA